MSCSFPCNFFVNFHGKLNWESQHGRQIYVIMMCVIKGLLCINPNVLLHNLLICNLTNCSVFSFKY